MVDNPWPVVQASVKAGVHCVTLQVENTLHLHHMLHWLGEQNAEVSGGTMPLLRGISLCPATPLEHILPVIEDVEIVQILAVNPGYGSKLSRSVLLRRIAQVVALLNASGKRDTILLAVDGSLTLEELPEIIASGVDRVVREKSAWLSANFSDGLNYRYKWARNAIRQVDYQTRSPSRRRTRIHLPCSTEIDTVPARTVTENANAPSAVILKDLFMERISGMGLTVENTIQEYSINCTRQDYVHNIIL